MTESAATLADFGIIHTPLQPVEIFDETKYTKVTDGLSFTQARDYCLQNLKTHPKEKLWFYLVPVAGTYRVVREATD